VAGVHVREAQPQLVVPLDVELADVGEPEAEVADRVVGRRGRLAPRLVAVAVGEGERPVGVEAGQVDRVAVAAPDRDVRRRAERVGTGLAGGDDQLDDRARVVDDVAADDGVGVRRVGQPLLDDGVVLVAEVAGRRSLAGTGQAPIRTVCSSLAFGL
jgi:hypothetical protein